MPHRRAMPTPPDQARADTPGMDLCVEHVHPQPRDPRWPTFRVGLLIAMVVLVAEVIYYRKQEKPRVKSIKTVGNFIRVTPSNTHY